MNAGLRSGCDCKGSGAARRNRVALMVLHRRSSCCATTPRLTPSTIFIASLAGNRPGTAALRWCCDCNTSSDWGKRRLAASVSPRTRRGSSLKPSPAAPRQPMRSARSSGQRPNRQLVATRRHGTATINSILRLSLTLTGSLRFMKYAVATSGHQFPLVRFPASRATLEFTTKFIVMSAGCPCATAAPHTLRYILASLAGNRPGTAGRRWWCDL